MPYIPHTKGEVRAMLDLVGVKSVDELFEQIPPDLRPASFDLPKGRSEMEVMAHLQMLASRGATHLVSFLGAGFYDHFVPGAVDRLAGRGEFYTAYTPYQPEASQGTLQAIFEYQSAMARLMGLDCANASVYDGGTALFEAMMMAVRATRKTRFVISEAVNPIYRIMLDSYTSNLNLEFATVPVRDGAADLDVLAEAVNDRTAAVIVQNPDFFGNVRDYGRVFEAAHAKKALGVISTYPVLQSVLQTPGEMGADIAVAEGQSLGLPLSFGGPYLGVMACSKKLIRQMPGRIAGRTKDERGGSGYVLTLQAREQHIRRQKATSNICSNQALCALRALIYVCLLGEEGMRRTAGLSIERAHFAAERFAALPGVELVNPGAFGNEFVLRLPVPAALAIDRLTERGFVPGFPLGRYYRGMDDCLLVACTEKRSREEIGIMAEMLGGLS